MLEVELFTTDHVIRGYVETGGERLSDMLNNRKESSVLITEAYMMRLLNVGKTAPARIFEASVEKQFILFARPVAQDLTHKSLFRRTTRQIYRIAVNLPAFEIQGSIHTTGSLDIQRILIERPEDFIPLTAATARYMLNPRLVIQSSILVFNKAHVRLIAEILSDDAPRGESAAKS